MFERKMGLLVFTQSPSYSSLFTDFQHAQSPHFPIHKTMINMSFSDKTSLIPD